MHPPRLRPRASQPSAVLVLLVLLSGVGLVGTAGSASAVASADASSSADVGQSDDGSSVTASDDGVLAADLTHAAGKVTVFVRTSGEPALETRTRLRRKGLSARSVTSSVESRVRAIEKATGKVETLAQQADPSAVTLYTTQYAAAGVAMQVDADALPELAAQPGVERISRIHLWTTDDDAQDGDAGPGGVAEPQNATTDVLSGALSAWSSGHTGQGAVVAVLDTGLDYTHADFGGTGTPAAYTSALQTANGTMSGYDANKVVPGRDFAGATYDGINVSNPTPDNNPVDGAGGGHGTHVAGTVAGYGVTSSGATFTGGYAALPSPLTGFSVGPGLAPQAKILPLKIFGDGGGSTGLGGAALDWIAQQVATSGQRIDVASLSIGANLTGIDESTAEIVETLMDNSDVLVVIAAGNSNDITDVGGYPGNVGAALTVAASDSGDKVASFSARGVHGSYEQTVKPDVTAPGVSIVSAGRGTGTQAATMSGTSMATPAVSGIAALVRALHPTWSALRVKAQIMNTAVHDVAAPAYSVSSGTSSGTAPGAPARVGTGRVDATAATDSDVWVVSDENTAVNDLVTASFGVVEVSAPTTQTRTLTLTSTGTSAITYDVGYQARDTMPGVVYSLSTSTVTVPAATGSSPGTATVTLTMTITDPTLLLKRRDTTMAASLSSGTTSSALRQYVADASGVVSFLPSGPSASLPTAKPLRLAVYAAPKPVSTMSATSLSYGAASTEGTLALGGTGVSSTAGAASSAEQLRSLVAPLVLGATSPQTASSATDPQAAAADLRAVGASTTAPQLSTSRSNGLVTFGVATQGSWAQIVSWDGDLVVHIDTGTDGKDDYRVTLDQKISGSYYVDDQVYASLSKVTWSGSSATTTYVAAEPLNTTDATTDTNQFDTNVALLPVRISKLGFTDAATSASFRYRVTLGSDSAPSASATSSAGWVTFDAYSPTAWFGPSAATSSTVLFPDAPGSLAAHRQTATSSSPDLLLLHLHNASGQRWETVSAAQGDTVTPTVSGVSRAGDFRVGDQLEVAVPGWSSLGTVTYQWLRSGVPVPGATSARYMTVSADVGSVLTVRATLTTTGGTVVPATSAPVAVRLGTPTVLSSPSIGGSPAVGNRLTAADGAWQDADGSTVSHQWLRDGTAIPGATATTYLVVGADVGHRLQVQVVVTRGSLASQPATSGYVTAGTMGSQVSLRSSAATRQYAAATSTVLTAVLARPAGTAGAVTFLDGTRVLGTARVTGSATTVTWTLSRTLSVGSHTLTARFAPDAGSGVVGTTSSAVGLRVTKATASAKVTTSKKRLKRGGRLRVTVKVTATGTTATGRFTIKDGSRTVARGTLKKGSRAVVLRRLKVGKHRLTIVYAGSATVAKKTSKAVTVRVRR